MFVVLFVFVCVVMIDFGVVCVLSVCVVLLMFDDDLFVWNDGVRVLDRVKMSGTAATTTDEGCVKFGVLMEMEVVKDEMVRDEVVRGVVVVLEVVLGLEVVLKLAASKSASFRVTESSIKVDMKVLFNNMCIKMYNNVLVDFLVFLCEGYDVKVIYGNDYIVREDGFIVKDYLIGEGESSKDN